MPIKITYLTGQPLTPVGWVNVRPSDSYLAIVAELHAAGYRIVRTDRRAN